MDDCGGIDCGSCDVCISALNAEYDQAISILHEMDML